MQQNDSMAATNGPAILQPAMTPHIAALNCSKHRHGLRTKQNSKEFKPLQKIQQPKKGRAATTNHESRLIAADLYGQT
mgnify:FL=1